MTAGKPISDMITGKLAKWPSATGRPSNGFLITRAHAVCSDKQQEQADTDAGTVRNALRQVAQDPATNSGRGDHGKQHTHQEHGAQRNRHTNMLTQHQTERGKRSERDSAADSQRQVRPQAHHDGANACNQ